MHVLYINLHIHSGWHTMIVCIAFELNDIELGKDLSLTERKTTANCELVVAAAQDQRVSMKKREPSVIGTG